MIIVGGREGSIPILLSVLYSALESPEATGREGRSRRFGVVLHIVQPCFLFPSDTVGMEKRGLEIVQYDFSTDSLWLDIRCNET